MIGGQALASHAIGDAARRAQASEWGGPAPASGRRVIAVAGTPTRRATVRNP